MGKDQWIEAGRSMLEHYEAAKTPTLAFSWGQCWTFAPTYGVTDFAAELGYFVAGWGFLLNALGPDYAMARTGDGSAFFAFEKAESDPSGLRLEFMVENIYETLATLSERGIEPIGEPDTADAPMVTVQFCAPSGLIIKLWSMLG